MSFSTLFSISRPRFWLYLAGTYVVGYTAGMTELSQFLSPAFWLHFLFFLLPGNLFLYGVNDVFDGDTDALNAKKQTQEHLLTKDEHQTLAPALWTCVGLAVVLVVLFWQSLAAIVWFAWLWLSFSYSAFPLRFKAKPLIDSASNVLYVLPGVLGYVQTTGTMPPQSILLAAWSWVAAMHLFSAIPDIVSDMQAKLKTTAVVIGAKASLVVCLCLWLLAALLVAPWHLLPAIIGLIYPLIPLTILLYPQLSISRVYWWFPWLNAGFGAMLFWLVLVV